MTDFDIMVNILQRSDNTVFVDRFRKVIVIDQGFDSNVEIAFNEDGSIR